MVYYGKDRLPDATDKAAWNYSCELLSGLIWVRERLENEDYEGNEAHPIDASNTEADIYAILHSEVLKLRATEQNRYRELLDAVGDIEISFRTEEITAQLVGETIRLIRKLLIFKDVPMDQEVPERMEYTSEEERE